MSNSKPSSANLQAENIEPSFVKRTVSDLREVYSMDRPETDKEVSDRIYEYFSYCEKTGMRPGVELLCLFLGVSRTTLWNWENGIKCTQTRQEMIVHAKSMIAAFLEQSHLQGKLNPASAIFLCKSWLGYSEDVTIKLESQTMLNQFPKETIEQIIQRRKLEPMAIPEKPELD